MAENLNYNVTNSKCYDDKPANCAKYGRLYNWNTAMNNSASSTTNPSGVQGVCPAGWHFPSQAEWTVLMNFVGSDNGGTKLKAISGWNDNKGAFGGTDNYGFSALPGGLGYPDGSFEYVDNGGYWWNASEFNNDLAYFRIMYYSDIYADGRNYYKSHLLSVRCVKD
jgi:uncharacterized protein (TIGR02145 family)